MSTPTNPRCSNGMYHFCPNCSNTIILPEWQPIATAPKDGTPIVVRFRDDRHEPEVVRWINDHWRTSDTCALWPPDVWMPLMPLPAPPVDTDHEFCEPPPGFRKPRPDTEPRR